MNEQQKARIVELAKLAEGQLVHVRDLGLANKYGRQHAKYAAGYSAEAFRIAQEARS